MLCSRIFNLVWVLLVMGAIIPPIAANAKRVEGPGGIYSLEVPKNMTVEYRETAGCRMHFVQDNDAVFVAIVSSCFDEFVYPTLEKFAEAKLRGIKKPNWKETLRDKVSLSGVPAVHGQGTYTLTVKDYKIEMLSDLYFIFAGQCGFEVELFHPNNDLYPYQKMKNEILAGLKVQGGGQAGQPDDFDRVLRKTWTDIQSKKDQPDPKLKRLIDDLKSRDVLVRLKAAKSLGKLGPAAKDAIPVLTEVAKHDADEDVRKVAARALANIEVGSTAVSSETGKERQAVPKGRTEGTAPTDKTDETGSIGPDQETLALAKEVSARINESYYSLMATNLQSFQSEYTVTRDGAGLGKLQIRWERDRPRLEISFSGSLEPKFQTWLSNSVKFSFRSTILSRLPAQAEYPVQAIRTGNGYEVDYSADPSVVVHKTYVTVDFRRLRDFQHYEDGLKISTEFVVRHAESKHFVKSLTRQVLKPGMQELKNTLVFTYTHREQHIFLKRLVIEDITPSRKTIWKLELQDVTLKSSKNK